MNIDTFILPIIGDNEEHFANSIAILIDVLRASTTICAALHNGAREIIPAENMDKALLLHSNLSRDTRHLAGEINGLKPMGFDSGNSPLEFTHDRIKGKSIVLTTTNGTKLFNLIKTPNFRIIGSFTNLNAINEFLKPRLKDYNINIFCAGSRGRFAFEDVMCAGAIIDRLELNGISLSDSSIASKTLYSNYKNDLNNFIKKTEHARKLIALGMDEDIDDALSFDRYPVLPYLEGHSFRIYQ